MNYFCILSAGKGTRLGFNQNKGLIKLNKKTMLDLKKSTTSDYYFSRNSFIISKLDSLQYGDNLHAIKPFEILCDSKYCPASNNGKALYFDDDHLSIAGAEQLIAMSISLNYKKLTKASTRTVKSGATSATLQSPHF